MGKHHLKCKAYYHYSFVIRDMDLTKKLFKCDWDSLTQIPDILQYVTLIQKYFNKIIIASNSNISNKVTNQRIDFNQHWYVEFSSIEYKINKFENRKIRCLSFTIQYLVISILFAQTTISKITVGYSNEEEKCGTYFYSSQHSM